MEVPCEMLLHPELLSNEQLKHIILQRHLRLPDIHNMVRDDLLELFHQFCLPFGQRKYRDTGRGKILNKTRHMVQDSPPKLNTFNNCQSRKMSNNNDRLKPPPDLLSGHMKRIKIENLVPVNNEVNRNKRKMSVDPPFYSNHVGYDPTYILTEVGDFTVKDSPSSIESPSPAKKERKPITWP